MDMQIAPPTIELHPLNPLRLRVSAGRHLTSVSGTVWVTLDGELRDIIIEGGQTYAFERAGQGLVQALGEDARLVAEDGVEVAPAGAFTAAWEKARDLWQGLVRAPGNFA